MGNIIIKHRQTPPPPQTYRQTPIDTYYNTMKTHSVQKYIWKKTGKGKPTTAKHHKIYTYCQIPIVAIRTHLVQKYRKKVDKIFC